MQKRKPTFSAAINSRCNLDRVYLLICSQILFIPQLYHIKHLPVVWSTYQFILQEILVLSRNYLVLSTLVWYLFTILCILYPLTDSVRILWRFRASIKALYMMLFYVGARQCWRDSVTSWQSQVIQCIFGTISWNVCQQRAYRIRSILHNLNAFCCLSLPFPLVIMLCKSLFKLWHRRNIKSLSNKAKQNRWSFCGKHSQVDFWLLKKKKKLAHMTSLPMGFSRRDFPEAHDLRWSGKC